MTLCNPTCEFCDELAGGVNNSFRALVSFEQLPSRIIKETANFVAIVSLGALVPGYILVLPKDHIFSIGSIPNEQWEEFTNLVDQLRENVEKKFNTKTIAFEHGSSGEDKPSGACIVHAHLHISPAIHDLENAILPSNSIKHQIRSIEELKKWGTKNKDYLYYDGLKGRKLVYELSSDIPSQYLRKLLADDLSLHYEWDWAVSPMLENLTKTVESLSSTKEQDPTISTYNITAKEYFEKTKHFDPSSKLKNDLENFVSKVTGKLILDAGAGSCRDSFFLFDIGFQVEAIDLAGMLLRESSLIFPNYSKRIMDIRHLGYADSTFDGIWCSAVLLHLDSNDIKIALQEFGRVLKLGALLHISLKEGQGQKRLYLSANNDKYREFYFYSVSDIRHLLLDTNFSVEYIKIDQEDDSSGERTNWIKCLAKKLP